MDKLASLIAIAYREHKRSWEEQDKWFFDHAQQCVSRTTSTSVLDKKKLREFATTYNVSRGLRAQREADYARIVYEKTKFGWPDNIEDRLKVLSCIVKKASEQTEAGDPKSSVTVGSQVSLASKTLWFLFPKRWFMFDRFVSAALRIETSSRVERSKQFHKRIDKLCEPQLLESVRSSMQDSTELHAERLVDKLLMFVGMSLYRQCDPAKGLDGKEWNPPGEEDYAFAERVLSDFRQSRLVKELQRLSLP